MKFKEISFEDFIKPKRKFRLKRIKRDSFIQANYNKNWFEE